MMHKTYDDILDYPWSGSPTKEHMPLSLRAKIFMPFAALKGFDTLLREKEQEHSEASPLTAEAR